MAVVAEKTGGFGVSPGFDPGMASHLSLGDGLGRGVIHSLAGGGTYIMWGSFSA